MKILHVCMNTPYIDGWGYQENLLPHYLNKIGVDSVVISSDVLPKRYLNGHKYPLGESFVEGVKVIRVKSKRLLNGLTFTSGLYKQLVKEKPDVIMHHALNFTTLPICSIYAMRHECRMVCDNHADFINCYQNKLYQLFFYRVLTGWTVNLFSKPIEKYYGVTWGRCDFLEKAFGVSKKKISFLPIGCDEALADSIDSKPALRSKYNYGIDDVILVSGGKMGVDKGTCSLIESVEGLNKQSNIKLILFGKFEDEQTQKLAESKPFVTIFGWCDRQKTLELLKLSDMAIWPIHHTTLCEDSIACGTPLLLRKTRTTEHLIDGNGYFMKTGSKEELRESIETFVNRLETEIATMNDCSKKMKNKLSYNNIARELVNNIM